MKHIKTILVLASLLVFGQGAWALHFVKNTGVEEGTESYPFLINSVEDLQNLAEDVNSGESYNGIYFKLTTDLNFSGKGFTPIGNGEEDGGKPFEGIFDGYGHKIQNINYENKEDFGVGLFGYIHYPAVIKNVSLDHCSFTGNKSVGAIVGNSAGGGPNEWGVFDCTAGADVEVTATEATIQGEKLPGYYAGGIIGFNKCLKVSNCNSEATVKGDNFVGSVAGYMLGSAAHEAIIQECYFTGSVKAVGGRGKDDVYFEKTDATNGIINITLYDNDDNDINAKRLSNYNGETVNVALSGRTLYKDNKWNTLCLPFAINDFKTETTLKDATVMKLYSSSFGDGTLKLDFESLNNLEAGQPCLVKWASGTDISNPIFQDVKINNTTNDAQTTYSDFKGNFSTVGLASWNMSVLYLGKDNKLYTPSKENFTIGAFRAYFQLKGVNAPAPYSEARASRFVMNFGGVEITSVNEVLRMKNEVPADAWYDLQGRKLNGKPNQKGIYINNGKRIVIK